MNSPEGKPLNPEKEGITTPTTFREKLRNIKDNITIEPLLATFVIPGALSRLATQNLNLEKACQVNLGYADHICSALIAKEGKQYVAEEIEIQKLTASMEIWKTFIYTAIPSFLILFLGAWSDRTGKRKLCILLPVFGDLLMIISNLINVYFFKEIPVQVTMFFEAFFPAITGGWVTIYMGVFSYIGDVSSVESRTFRVGITNLCLTAGGPIGLALSGVLLKSLGYYGVYGISLLMYAFSLSYGLYTIQDKVKPKDEIEKYDTGIIGFLKSFFDVKHVKDTLKVAFKSGPQKRRTKSILIFAAIAFIYGPSYGIFQVKYLFTRYRFQWDAVKYSMYNTIYICLHLLGAILSISVFSRRLKWDDAILGLISNVSMIVGVLGMGFARNSSDMYIAAVAEMFNATSFTALRSISTKLVTSDELGKMISLFNLMEIVTSMIFGPIYSWIYMVTITVDVGIMFYISVLLSIPAIVIFWWFLMQSRKIKKQRKDIESKLQQLEDNHSKIFIKNNDVILDDLNAT